MEFRDNGIGIENSMKEKIFEGEKMAGRGLGLSLIRRALEFFHGEIWVEDRVEGAPSRGSNFIVTS